MDIRDFTREELVRAITKFLRSGVYFNYADEYADALENGDWLEYLEMECTGWK